MCLVTKVSGTVTSLAQRCLDQKMHQKQVPFLIVISRGLGLLEPWLAEQALRLPRYFPDSHVLSLPASLVDPLVRAWSHVLRVTP
jgi:hypothetical protein